MSSEPAPLIRGARNYDVGARGKVASSISSAHHNGIRMTEAQPAGSMNRVVSNAAVGIVHSN